MLDVLLFGLLAFVCLQVEATSITAVAWASSVPDCSPAVSSAQHAAAGAGAGAGVLTDQLLVSTSCGCLLQLTVTITRGAGSSSVWTSAVPSTGDTMVVWSLLLPFPAVVRGLRKVNLGWDVAVVVVALTAIMGPDLAGLGQLWL